MERMYITDQTFEKTDFIETKPTTGEYENCTFVNCHFPNTDLSDISFSECNFEGCNLSLAKLKRTAFKDVRFKDCKLLGLYFEDCNEFLFVVDFDKCVLDHSSFYQRQLKKTAFKNSSLREVDFTEADLSNALFANCDLASATFENTILEKVDFHTSYNYSIDPELNRIKKARFSAAGVIGLLDKYDIEIK